MSSINALMRVLFAHFQILLPAIESILDVELVGEIKLVAKSHYNENCLINFVGKIPHLLKS